MEYAKQFVEGHDVELWQHDCRIATFNHKARSTTKHEQGLAPPRGGLELRRRNILVSLRRRLTTPRLWSYVAVDMIREAATKAASLLLVVELFGRDYASLWIGVKFHLLDVLDAFALPLAVIGFKFGYVRVARVKNFIDHVQGGHPVRPLLIGLRQPMRQTRRGQKQ
jgi:hypothetical protein